MAKDKKEERPPIPKPTERAVRQRCGFGCVICGLPLYEYHHMEEWATVKEHQASNITLLCDQHHKEVTNGLLPKSMVADANKDPINWKTGRSKPYSLHYSGREAEVSIGGAKCKQQDVGQGAYLWPLVIDGFPVVSVFLQDNHYLLNIFLFDKNNRLGISIVENQLVYNSGFYDVQLTGRKLTIRENYRQIIFDIRFDTPSTITFLRAYVWLNGLLVKLDKAQTIINPSNIIFSGGFELHGFNYGIVIGDLPVGGVTAFHFSEPLIRYPMDASPFWGFSDWEKFMGYK